MQADAAFIHCPNRNRKRLLCWHLFFNLADKLFFEGGYLVFVFFS
ncbi:MAG: hypothetical protein AVDCRST_MAG93-5 [uncultured Chloroflexia bacterium]|uniref:Uncharacterized protein n=1 Tax=uncultured Chloroflexia bacterium TaxID=1672391 RepID=A0A6J4GZV0_9CHLR|nr:MAG: hypothetical protein AVDCRST_MAG93-5 [uncultured Chloroflexia bacterium]